MVPPAHITKAFKGPLTSLAKQAQWASWSRMSKSVRRCSQAAGDVVYLPAMWAHAVINPEEVAGVAIELNAPVSKSLENLHKVI